MRISRRKFVTLAAAAGPLWASRGLLGEGLPLQGGPAAQIPQFLDVTTKSGIRYRHSFGEKELSSLMEGTGSGCAWIDYNNDGLLDLYVANGRYVPGLTNHSSPDGTDSTNHLYRNNGDGTFTDVTQEAGVPGKGMMTGDTAGVFANESISYSYVTGYQH